MAYVALTKHNALTLITTAIQNARARFAEADKDYVSGRCCAARSSSAYGARPTAPSTVT
jgi:hypothetical protein